MVTVYTTTDPKIVALLEMALRDAGLSFRVDNENAAMVLGAANPAMPISFQVRTEDQQSATRAIESALREMGEAPKYRKAE